MILVHKLSTYTLLALGLIHTLLTSLFYPAFNTDALWFAGTGLGLIFLGLLNLVMVRAPTLASINLCLMGNLVGLVYSISIVIEMPEPRAWAGLIAFMAITFSSIFSKKGFEK